MSKRMVESIAVGIVTVSSEVGNLSLSEDEKAEIISEVYEGLDFLQKAEPRANITFKYDIKNITISALSRFSIKVGWHDMPLGFTEDFDAILNGGGSYSGNAYFFKGDQYIKYNWNNDRAEPGYPVLIADGWHDMPPGFTENFDAILNGSGPFKGKVYFFKGDQYVSYDWENDSVDQGYPIKITDGWPGVLKWAAR